MTFALNRTPSDIRNARSILTIMPMKNRLAGILLMLLALLIFAENSRPGITHRIIREIQQVAKK
jgi:hypothetical protein